MLLLLLSSAHGASAWNAPCGGGWHFLRMRPSSAKTAPAELGTNALGLAEGVLAAPSPEQLAWAAQLGLLALTGPRRGETREAPEADLVL